MRFRLQHMLCDYYYTYIYVASTETSTKSGKIARNRQGHFSLSASTSRRIHRNKMKILTKWGAIFP